MNDDHLRLDALTDADFQSRIGQTFSLKIPSGEILELTLAEVHTHKYAPPNQKRRGRSEEHTSELQSQSNLVCRLLLEKKKVGAMWVASLESHRLSQCTLYRLGC